MKLERKHAVVLLGVAAWNVVTYATFARNLAADSGRPTGFYVAHTVLIVVNVGIAGVLGSWGVRAWRESRSASRS
ncbi:MAG: SCO4848 family membrane protein [Nocardioidaceae bacterium]